MAEKVKVPKEVASALDDLLLLNTNNDVMRIYFDAINVNEARQIPKSALVIRNLEPMQLAVILLNGYEIEQTPEEELLLEYIKLQKEVEKSWHPATKERLNFGLSCIRATLDIQGVKIEGINK